MADMQQSESTPAVAAPSTWRDELAYILPMACFLLFTAAGGQWPTFFPLSYFLKTFLTAGLIIYFWRSYTKIRWTCWWLGIIVGILGIVQWIGMEELLRRFWPDYPRPGASTAPFDPYQTFQNSWLLWSFMLVRWAGAALVVPFMEELFWRDYLWRRIAAPNDFKIAEVGELDWPAVWVVAIAFASVHSQWMTAVVWGLMIAALLIYTRSIGACIIAHGVTNFLLGAYVQWTHDWYYW